MPDRLHNEFGQDIQTFARNLGNLVSVVEQAHPGFEPASRQASTTTDLNQILGDFNELLRDCFLLLDDKSVYATQAFPYNIQWYLQVKEEVEQLRDRIAFLNIKVYMACPLTAGAL